MKNTFHKDTETRRQLANFILKANRLSMGDQCRKFESNLSTHFETKSAIFLNSGSSANLILLQSLINMGRLKIGDKVGFSSVTWATNVMPIMQLGLVPVPIEINLSTLNVSSLHLKESLRITPNLKCLFITNLLGLCDDLDKIRELCLAKNIILLEDNCEALGSEYKGQKLGTFGLAATHSTYVGHHISTIEGGFIVTSDEDLAEMIQMVRSHGWNRTLPKDSKTRLRNKWNVDEFYDLYTFYEVGMNLRPTEIAGFIGNLQLRHLSKISKQRQLNHKEFADNLNNKYQTVDYSHMSIYSSFAFPIIAHDRKEFEMLKKKLEKSKIEMRPIVGGNIIRQPFYIKNFESNVQFKNSDKVHFFGLYIPNRPDLTPKELQFIKSVLRKL